MIRDLVSAESPDWAHRVADTAAELETLYESGDISTDEYRELLTDLAGTLELDEHADNMDLKSSLVSAISNTAAVL